MARQVRSNRIEIPADRVAELQERIRRNSRPNLNGCWEWQLVRNAQGYGNTTAAGMRGAAHRFSYAAFKGVVPAGLVVCHQCDNTSCVNPEHLFVATQEENAHDCMAKGRANFPEKLEYCKRGLHRMEGRNVLISKKEKTDKYWRGGRQCRACKMDSIKRALLKKKSWHLEIPGGSPYCGEKNMQVWKGTNDWNQVTCRRCLQYRVTRNDT